MFKFKFSDKSVSDLEPQIRDKMRGIIRDPRLLNELGELMVKDIKFQVRRGKNPETGQKFKALSKAWIKERKKISEGSGAHDTFRPRRSNITLSGQLLDSLSIIMRRGASVIIGFIGTHQPYRAAYLETFKRKGKTVNSGKSGMRTIGKPISNDKLAEYVQEIRPFMSIRPKLIDQMKSIVIRFIRRNI